MIEEIESIRVPVVDKKSPRGFSVESYPIIYPHRILAYLFDEVEVEVLQSDVSEYWAHARRMGEPWARLSPASEQHVPLGIHGDAARLWTQYRVEKICAVFLNMPTFRPRSVRYSRWMLFSIPRDKLVKNRTLNIVWEKLVWSLNACFSGVNPSEGPRGGPLTGKDLARAGRPLCRTRRTFCVTELRGDWEWHRDIWRFTASWQGQDVCFKCPAVTKGNERYVYYNTGPTSSWLQEEFTLEQFISRRLKERQLCTLSCNMIQVLVISV